MKREKQNFSSLVFLGLMAFLCSGLFSCNKNEGVNALPDTYAADAAVKWADMTLYVSIHTASNTPTYGSRALAYLGLTMYESVQAGAKHSKSMANQLNDLSALPTVETGKRYNWAISLNAGQAFMMKKMYEHAANDITSKIDSLAKAILTQQSELESSEDIARSVKFGESIANALYEWSKTDGGHQGYERNFPFVIMPTTPGSWRPPTSGQSASQTPLHPFWGENRTFVKANNSLGIPAMIPYSTDKTSPYYAQFLEVYNKNKVLTQTEKEIAAWWGDDPSETFAPPGHSYNLATIAIKMTKQDIFKAAETYARVGMATADAFINCWKCKFKYYAERPASYVNNHIDPTWVQFWPEPPFPAFTSGHATQSMAAAIVLTDMYGSNFKFTDNSHEGRPINDLRNVEYKNRSFNSFIASADESAYSRFLGGIHTRQDNEVGSAEGVKIGTNINLLLWHK